MRREDIIRVVVLGGFSFLVIIIGLFIGWQSIRMGVMPPYGVVGALAAIVIGIAVLHAAVAPILNSE